ncbi:GNAT family N-acetyltransferase [Corynebacterium kutscheri]|nr:GNAT family N-acetyltransferase [Corynebacterium kutscheri]
MNAIFSVARLADLSSLELHRIYKLRVDVFVQEQHCAYAEIDDIDAANTTVHFQACSTTEPSELIGYARMYPTEHGLQLGRLVVSPAHRGTGLAAELMFQALRWAHEQHPESDIMLNAQLPLQEYYEAYGFVPAGEPFDDEGISHLPMALASTKLASIIEQRS